MPSRNNNRNASSAVHTSTEADNNNNNQPTRPSGPTPGPPITFHGRCADLPKTAIYDCGVHNQADIFVKTTKEIAIYAGSKLPCGTDTKLSIVTMSVITLEKPTDPIEDCSKTDEKIWEQQVTSYVKRLNLLEQNLKTVCTIVCGQCTDVLWARLKTFPEFEVTRTSGDVLGVLQLIKNIVFSFAGEKYTPMAVFQATRKLHNIRQQRCPLSEYLDRFNNQLNVLHQCGGTLVMPGVTQYSASLEEVVFSECSSEKQKDLSAMAEQRLAAVVFLCGANMRKHGRVLENLHNAFIQGINSYPADVGTAYRLLSNWQQADHDVLTDHTGARDVTFTTIGSVSLLTDLENGVLEDTGFQF